MSCFKNKKFVQKEQADLCPNLRQKVDIVPILFRPKTSGYMKLKDYSLPRISGITAQPDIAHLGTSW